MQNYHLGFLLEHRFSDFTPSRVWCEKSALLISSPGTSDAAGSWTTVYRDSSEGLNGAGAYLIQTLSKILKLYVALVLIILKA